MILVRIMLKRPPDYILHANIDVHSRRLIAEFSKDGIKCIEKLQSHCGNMLTGLSNKSHIKEGDLQ